MAAISGHAARGYFCERAITVVVIKAASSSVVVRHVQINPAVIVVVTPGEADKGDGFVKQILEDARECAVAIIVVEPWRHCAPSGHTVTDHHIQETVIVIV